MAMPIIGKMTYLKLIRWQNVLMVLITQVLTFSFIIMPLHDAPGQFTIPFLMLMLASLFIVSGGYIINDYYDVEIDRKNKPGKMVVGKQITRRNTLRVYLLHCFMGALAGIYTAFLLKSVFFGLLFIMAIGILWFYSYQLKKTLLWGNIVVAIMAAAPVYSVLMIIFFSEWSEAGGVHHWYVSNQKLVAFVFGYSFFAVTTHFMREIVKDIQDMDGDKAYRCMTVPIRYGKAKSVAIAKGLAVAVMFFLLIGFYVLYQEGFLLMSFYSIVLIAVMLFVTLRLSKAESSGDFGKAGLLVKWLMLFGILSMILIPFS
jgi:4-hydroxybenzoate polyprenyltransferase